ncbi:MAG: glycosyltransferase family 4 protein, partial [Planctomycetes bacterium]|nr:glycosyltransferase family 4 protein [Planctomycetota bacterium]
MHVAHFIQRFPPALGGSEAYFDRLSRWRHDQGDDVTVWTSTAIDLSAFWSSTGKQLRPGTSVEDGLTIRRYEPSHWFARRHFLKLLSFIPSAPWQCLTMTCNPVSLRMAYDAATEDRPCDLVHASALPYAWPLRCGLKLARRKKAPFFLTPFLHLGNPDDPRDRTRKIYTSRPMRYLLEAADVVFAQTEIERNSLRKLGIPDSRVILQGLGVDPIECTGGNRSVRDAWSCTPDDSVIGHLANLSPPKGTIDLLRAAKKAWERGSRFRIVLAGPAMPEFTRFWTNFEPKERVTILGPLSDQQKRDFYAGIDVFCLPSRSDSFGLVLLEAWANGKPNIGYRSGGIGELIQHGDDGLLVRCGDLDGLADAMTQMELDPERRQALGAVGQKRTEWEFRWEDKLRIVDGAMAKARRDPRGSQSLASGLG